MTQPWPVEWQLPESHSTNGQRWFRLSHHQLLLPSLFIQVLIAPVFLNHYTQLNYMEIYSHGRKSLLYRPLSPLHPSPLTHSLRKPRHPPHDHSPNTLHSRLHSTSCPLQSHLRRHRPPSLLPPQRPFPDNLHNLLSLPRRAHHLYFPYKLLPRYASP